MKPHRLSWLIALALAILGCSGGGPPASDGTPPNPPLLQVPGTGTVGFPVRASIQNPVSRLTYQWTVSPGSLTVSTGSTVSFTPAATGTYTLTCVAIKGNVIPSQPTIAPVQVSVPSPAAGSFAAAGILRVARQGLVAAQLPDGRVLAIGGASNAGGPALASTEFYDPLSQGIAPGPAMNAARSGHAIAALDPGRFLVTGGSTGGASAEIFSSGLGSQGLFTPAGSPSVPDRSGHTATAMGGSPSPVLVAGGQQPGGSPATAADRYDGGSWTVTGSVALAPGHTATLLPSGKVLLVSHTADWQPLALLYDPVTRSFSHTAGAPGAGREGHRALLLGSPARVLILGGDAGAGPTDSAEWYDPASGTFTPLANRMASPRKDFGVAPLPTGQVLLMGGTADGRSAVATGERFDPASGTFTPTGAMATPRRNPAVVVLSSGKVVVLGGFNETQGALATIEAF